MDIAALRSRLLEVGQEHLLQHWDSLSSTEQQSLYKDLTNVNFKRLAGYFAKCQSSLTRAGAKVDNSMEPLPEEYVGSVRRTDAQTLAAYEAEGLCLQYCMHVFRRICVRVGL